MKIEYTNAQLECNAADERAKLLASEVIGLEEKVGYDLGNNFEGEFLCFVILLKFFQKKINFGCDDATYAIIYIILVRCTKFT